MIGIQRQNHMIYEEVEYEKEGHDADTLETFWTDVQNRLKTPLLRDLFRLLKNERMTGETGRNL